MTNANESRPTDDPYDLGRFVRAQEDDYEQALSEIMSGQKRTHWMWYIFPQIDGLAFSSTSKRYSIKSIEEARAYLDHPVLGSECVHGIHAKVVALEFASPAGQVLAVEQAGPLVLLREMRNGAR